MDKNEPPDVLSQRCGPSPFGPEVSVKNPLLRPLDGNNITEVLLNFQDATSYLSNDNTKTFVGKLCGMCSAKEYNQKTQMNTANDLERNHLKEVDTKLTLKSFQRSDASRIFKPEDVRPVLWCRRTLYYILAYFVDADINKKNYIMGKKFTYLDIYNFLRDRLRSIWQDLTVQHCTKNRGYIECFEISIRFLIYSNEILCENEEYDASQNLLLLNTCLDKLMNGYSDVHSTTGHKNLINGFKLLTPQEKNDCLEVMDVLTYKSPYEAEFWSYRLLLLIPQLLTPEGSALFCDICQRIPTNIKKSDIIRFSLKVCLSVTSGNIYSYFNLMNDPECHPLQSALMNRFSGCVRIRFLYDIITHKVVKDSINPIHFVTLKTIFGLKEETDTNLLNLLKRYGIIVDTSSEKLYLESVEMEQLEYDNNYLNKVSGKIQTTSSVVANKITSKYPSRQLLFDPDFDIYASPVEPTSHNVFETKRNCDLHGNIAVSDPISPFFSPGNNARLRSNVEHKGVENVIVDSESMFSSHSSGNKDNIYYFDKIVVVDNSNNMNSVNGITVQEKQPNDLFKGFVLQNQIPEITNTEFVGFKNKESRPQKINDTGNIAKPSSKRGSKRPIVISRPKLSEYIPAESSKNEINANAMKNSANSILRSLLSDKILDSKDSKNNSVLDATLSNPFGDHEHKFSGFLYRSIKKGEIYLSRRGSQQYLKRLLFLTSKSKKIPIFSQYNSDTYDLFLENAQELVLNGQKSLKTCGIKQDDIGLVGKRELPYWSNNEAKRPRITEKMPIVNFFTHKITSLLMKYVGFIRHLKCAKYGDRLVDKQNDLTIDIASQNHLLKSLYNVIVENSEFIIEQSKRDILEHTSNQDVSNISVWGSGIFLHLKLFDMDYFQNSGSICNNYILNEIVKFKKKLTQHIDPEYNLSLKLDVLNICGINVEKKELFKTGNETILFELFKNVIPCTVDKETFNIPFHVYATINPEPVSKTQNNPDKGYHGYKFVNLSYTKKLNKSLINIFLLPRPISIEDGTLVDILMSKGKAKTLKKIPLISVTDSLIALSYLFGSSDSYLLPDEFSGLYILCYRISVSAKDLLTLFKLFYSRSYYEDGFIYNEPLNCFRKRLETYMRTISEEMKYTLTEHSIGYNIPNAPEIIEKQLVLSCVGFQAKEDSNLIFSAKEPSNMEKIKAKHVSLPIIRLVYSYEFENSLKNILNLAVKSGKMQISQKRFEFDGIFKLLVNLTNYENDEITQDMQKVLCERIQLLINHIIINFPEKLWDSCQFYEDFMDKECNGAKNRTFTEEDYSKSVLIAMLVKLQYSVASVDFNRFYPEGNTILSVKAPDNIVRCNKLGFLKAVLEHLGVQRIVVPYVVGIFLSNVNILQLS